MLCLDSLVPEEHLVRKLEKVIDLCFIHEFAIIKIIDDASFSKHFQTTATKKILIN